MTTKNMTIADKIVFEYWLKTGKNLLSYDDIKIQRGKPREGKIIIQ